MDRESPPIAHKFSRVQGVSPRKHRKTRPQFLHRDQLDGRTNVGKEFRRIVGAIETDLGGREELTEIEANLIEAFAGTAIWVNNLNAKLALGEEVDPSTYSHIASTMVRVASRLGLGRRSRDVTPRLVDYLSERDGDDGEA